MNFVPLGIVTDHITGRQWNFYITDIELHDREIQRATEAYRQARKDGEEIGFIRTLNQQCNQAHTP